MKSLLSIVFFSLLWKVLFSQSVLIAGTVRNADNQALSGVIVSVYKDSSTAIFAYAITNAVGVFELKQLKKLHPYRIKFSLIGYSDTTILFFDNTQDVSKFNFEIQLKSGIKNLKDVLVQTNRKIIERGDTTIYNAADFGADKESRLEDVLKNLPGIQVDDAGNIKFKGKPVSKVLIEGDDLFGNNYKLMTQSLGANTLSKIEAIENDSDNPLLKEFAGFKQTNLNIKLKKEFLFRIFGEAVIRKSIDPRYAIDANIYSIAGKNKFSIIGNANNSGFDNRVKGDITSSATDNVFERMNANINEAKPFAYEFINPPRLPLLARERYLINNDQLVSANYIRKISSRTDLRSNLLYLNSVNDYGVTKQTNFINTLFPVTLNEQQIGTSTLQNYLLDNRVTYLNKTKVRVIYSNQVFSRNLENDFFIGLPVDTILPVTTAAKKGVANKINITFNTSSTTTIDLTIGHQYTHLAQYNNSNTNDTSFKQILGIFQGDAYRYNTQNKFNSFFFNSDIYFKEYKRNETLIRLSGKIRGNYINEIFNNKLEYYSLSNELQTGSMNFNRINSFEYSITAAGLKFFSQYKKWELKFEPELVHERFGDKSVSKSNSYVYLNPWLSVKYKIKGSSYFELSGSNQSRAVDYHDVFAGSRFTDYRSIQQSFLLNSSLPLIRENRAGITYSNTRISKGIIFQASLSLSKSVNPVIGNFSVSPFVSIDNRVFGSNPYSANTLFILFEKAIPKLKSYFTFNNFSMRNMFESRNASFVIQQEAISFQNDISIRTEWHEQFTSKVTYGGVSNFQKIKNDNNLFTSSMAKLKTDFSFSSKSKKLMLKASGEQYWFSGKANSQPFLFLNMHYQLKKNRAYLTLTCNNLLNNMGFDFFNASITNINQQTTILQERLFLLGISLRF
ncbi:MAG: carboxypeptidase-like regulatory domain-containing protein [Chitinophagaceae bacterium]|nr:carboxypeptidase-like regulatory domain-containing protein [Chitinophagaceae bacterium]